MNMLVQSRTLEELNRQIQGNYVSDYVYMYPPRQAYRSISDEEVTTHIASSLAHFDDINLYVHFPFCRQICAFCNLYTHVSTDQEVFNSYLFYLERELQYYLPWIRNKPIKTLYLGGGTPTLLPAELFERFFLFLEQHFNCSIKSIAEVAIEASPDTVEKKKFLAYKEAGINRVNLGVQSATNHELSLIGRKYGSNIPFEALEIIQEIQFDNVCVDLIYGLEGQTFEDWRKSVDSVISYAPETICAYSLTLRPITGFDRKGYHYISGAEQYEKYDYVNEALLASGYQQETQVRWIKNEKGGYRQKANHWGMNNILGIGAGARSYLWQIDTRNGYSIKDRRKAFQNYLKSIDEAGQAVTDIFLMDEDERRRKSIVLGLINLDREWFLKQFGLDPIDVFPSEFSILFELELLLEDGKFLKLTPRGVRHRDLIVQQFFSRRVKDLLETFNYEE